MCAGPLGSSLLIIVYNNYHVSRGHLVLVYLLLFIIITMCAEATWL